MANSIGQGGREDDGSARPRAGLLQEQEQGQGPEGRGVVGTDFFDFDVASPQVILRTYYDCGTYLKYVHLNLLESVLLSYQR